METKDDLAVSDSTETVGLNVTTTGARALSLCDTDKKNLYMETLESLEAASCK